MFRFEDPLFFLFLLFIPLMILYFFKNKGGMKIQYSSLKVIKAIKSPNKSFGQYFLLFLRLVAVILIIVSLARPQIHEKVTEVISSGIDIMLVLDTSGSMRTKDYSISGRGETRLDIVKDVVYSFIKKRPGDRIGMVVFGTFAFTQCPVTLDHDMLINFIKDIHIGVAGESTAIGSAVGVAVKRLKDIKAKSKIIILLTDGRSNAGKIAPLTSAELAKTYDIKIYTIGVGSSKTRSHSFGGGFYGYNTGGSSLDAKTLQKMATITGGKYFVAYDTEELKKIYSTINQLEKTKIKVKEYGKNTELYLSFLIPGFLLLLLELLLANTIFSKIP